MAVHVDDDPPAVSATPRERTRKLRRINDLRYRPAAGRGLARFLIDEVRLQLQNPIEDTP
ncbi:hypothetical protein [Burkholderia latens]|uniref:hypothetical protein n=1 Tax=Burkholderia latens TaxID=488446 RepID=UPI00158F3370|nr:hypothetical protein [Burkholderia latens]